MIKCLKDFYFLLYFQIIVSCTLKHPIAASTVFSLVGYQNQNAALVCLFGIMTSYFSLYGPLFWRAYNDKTSVLDFLDLQKEATLIKVPSQEFATHFDFSFLIPSVIKPQRFLDYFTQNRLHVFVLKRGKSSPIASATAFVSPLAIDVYIFLRDRLETLTDGVRYRITHELGHAAAIFSIVAQRNAVGLLPVFLSIFWIACSHKWTPIILCWTILQLIFAFAFIVPIFQQWKHREHLNSELVADYMALRHLPEKVISSLMVSGTADLLIQDDNGLSPEQNRERKQIFSLQITRLHRGGPIDVPKVYMDETFKHPMMLTIFVYLQFAFLVTTSASQEPSLLSTAIFALVSFLYFFRAGVADGKLRNEILQTIDRMKV